LQIPTHQLQPLPVAGVRAVAIDEPVSCIGGAIAAGSEAIEVLVLSFAVPEIPIGERRAGSRSERNVELLTIGASKGIVRDRINRSHSREVDGYSHAERRTEKLISRSAPKTEQEVVVAALSRCVGCVSHLKGHRAALVSVRGSDDRAEFIPINESGIRKAEVHVVRQVDRLVVRGRGRRDRQKQSSRNGEQ
jgi:hypothetical protein